MKMNWWHNLTHQHWSSEKEGVGKIVYCLRKFPRKLSLDVYPEHHDTVEHSLDHVTEAELELIAGASTADELCVRYNDILDAREKVSKEIGEMYNNTPGMW